MFILFLKKYRIPDRKKVLKAAGLGHKKLILDAAMAAGDLRETLFNEFPKLRDAGGFQFARTPGHQKEIEVIPLPPGGGHSVANLKAVANQTFIFLRPIQRELDISELDDAGEQPIVDDTMQECFGCGVDIPETRLIKHRQSCSGIRNEVIDQPGLAAIPPEQLSTSISGPASTTHPRQSSTPGPSTTQSFLPETTPHTSSLSDRYTADYVNLIEDDISDDEVTTHILKESLLSLEDDSDQTALHAKDATTGHYMADNK
ncbi:uncharacterized protein [Apostichopus japonicus]|uniref:uncharacterized protein isoform X1 n=2 Tax=Stichopus japonicus TaxID=307972 RepID=UPI003AB739CC